MRKTYDKLKRMLSWMCFIPLSIIFVKAVQGEETEFVKTKMTWQRGYDYCVEANKRLMYVIPDFSTHETERLVYLKEVSASLDVSELYFWTIHKVNNQTNRGERFYTDSPVENFMYDNSFLLCVYHVYERYRNRLGWEADNCLEKEQYVMCSDRVSSFYLSDEKIIFLELWNYMVTNKIQLMHILAKRTYECEEECLWLRTYGLYCVGFIYNRAFQKCMLLGQSSTALTRPYYHFEKAEVQIRDFKQLFELGASTDKETTGKNSGKKRGLNGDQKVTPEEKVRVRRRARPATIRAKSVRDTSDEKVSDDRTTTPANKEEKSLTATLDTSDEKVSDGRTTKPANIGEKSLTVTSDEKVSGGRTATPANNGEKSLTVTSDEKVSDGRTATPANNGVKSLTDLSTLVTSDEKVSDGRTATPANNGEKSLTVTSDEKVSGNITATPANNGEKALTGQIHTITGAVIGVMSSFVILYHAAPIMKGLLKLVPKTADEEITQKEGEDHVSDTIAIAMSDIDAGKLFTRRIDIWSVPPISHSDVVS